MTPGQLRSFLAVARHGSVRAAAETLFVTQPAVSAAIGSLERDLGVPLVVREGRGIRLTPSGEILAGFAAQTLGLLEQARDATLAAAHPGRGRLRVAAVITAGEHVVPPILKAFRARYPEVELALEVGNRSLVLERVAAWEADLGVGGRPPEGEPIAGRPFLRNDLVVVGAPDHPLAGHAGIDPRALNDVWLLREPGSGTRTTTEEFLAAHGVEPRGTLTLGSNGAVKQAAGVGLGVALISAHAVSLELAAGTLARFRVRGTPLHRQWFLLYPERGVPPGPASAFLAFACGAAARRAVATALRQPAPG